MFGSRRIGMVVGLKDSNPNSRWQFHLHTIRRQANHSLSGLLSLISTVATRSSDPHVVQSFAAASKFHFNRALADRC